MVRAQVVQPTVGEDARTHAISTLTLPFSTLLGLSWDYFHFVLLTLLLAQIGDLPIRSVIHYLLDL